MNLESWSGVVLEGDRVVLRAMREEDAEAVVRWRNNPEVRRWFFSREQPTLASHIEWFRRRKPDRLDFVVCLKETGRPVGTVCFTDIDPVTGRAESGKMIGDPALWGKGIMAEAYRIWIAFGFQRLGLSHVRIRTKASNRRNIRLNERLGFRVEEVCRAGHRAGDGSEDILVMGLTREDAARLGIIAAGNPEGGDE